MTITPAGEVPGNVAEQRRNQCDQQQSDISEFALRRQRERRHIRQVLTGTGVDEAWTTGVLAQYFPTPLRERFASRMAGHRLRREIISTGLVNEVVNRGGTSFVYRAMEEAKIPPIAKKIAPESA